MTLKDEIVNLISSTNEYLDGEQILTRLAKKGIEIPKEDGLYNVNEFIELEQEDKIVWDSIHQCWRTV